MTGRWRSVRLRVRTVRAPVWRAVSEVAVALVVIAAVGAVLGPQWAPVPFEASLRLSAADTAIGAAPQVPHYPVRQTVVTVQLDGTTVAAQVSEPVGAPAGRPGVVFVHGAGTGRYQDAFVQQAHALAAAGVVTIVPDKRLDTYSTVHRDYVTMAGDYDRSVALLRSWPGVDPTRVGVYAESEGAWIAPVMAVQDPQLAFVVLVSAPVVPPRQQAAFAVDNYLRNTGVPGDVFRAIPRAVGLSVPGAFEYADFDVSRWQQQLRQPVLVAYGTDDASMPLVQGAEQIIADTAVAGNDAVTVRYYGGADHGLKVGARVVPAFLHDLVGWVLGLPATAEAAPRVAGATPHQEYRADPVPVPRWLHDSQVLVALVVAAAGVIALAGLLGLADRVLATARSAAGPRPVRRLAPRLLALTVACSLGCLLTVGALAWYLITVARLALDYERDALVVTGGWVGVRLAGIATVTAGVLALRAAAAARERHEPVVVGVLPHLAVGLALVGCLVLLVVLAYWGAFQLGI